MNDEWDYKIDGKSNGKFRIIFLFIVAAFFTILTIDQLKGTPNKSLIVAAIFGIIAVSSICLLIKLLIRYFCFKVFIGKKGFYFQTNPFNSRYYEYSQIKSCREELKSSRAGYASQASQPACFYYFYFTDKNGKTVKFQFEKALYEHEFNVLKERINNSL